MSERHMLEARELLRRLDLDGADDRASLGDELAVAAALEAAERRGVRAGLAAAGAYAAQLRAACAAESSKNASLTTHAAYWQGKEAGCEAVADFVDMTDPASVNMPENAND